MSYEVKSYFNTFFLSVFNLKDNKTTITRVQRYQYILMFLLRDESRSFKITEIQDGVLSEAHRLFKEDKKDRNPSSIKKKSEQIIQ